MHERHSSKEVTPNDQEKEMEEMVNYVAGIMASKESGKENGRRRQNIIAATAYALLTFMTKETNILSIEEAQKEHPSLPITEEDFKLVYRVISESS